MRKPKHSQEDIARILREVAEGDSPVTVCRRHGISSATYYRWQSKARLQVSFQGDRLRALESENRRLKQKVAELSLDYQALRVALVQDPNTDC